jgi:hypothetical protein
MARAAAYRPNSLTTLRARCVLLAGLLVGLSSPLSAQSSGLISASNIEAILDVAKKYGLAEMQTTQRGDPKIVGRLDETRYAIYFEGCKEARDCKNIQFYAGWSLGADKKVSSDRINEWNRTKRWGKAYLDQSGDPAIEMDVNLFGSVTRDNFDDTVDWWRVVVKEFEAYISK